MVAPQTPGMVYKHASCAGEDGPSLGRGAVGGDPTQPGTDRGAPVEPLKTAPRGEQRLLSGNRHRKQDHPRRLMTLEEMANTAVFMASDKASGMTGTTVQLDHG
jgi:NAD(P)-dependent dehydrogenase (short-subunit alcohol dehydrogenase family)